jgi:hypothetical protein
MPTIADGPRESGSKTVAAASAVIRGMQGLGDNIYTRAAVRAYTRRKGPVYIYTSWPQVYWDLPDVFPVRPETESRTQNEHMARVHASAWNALPGGLREIGCGYWPDNEAILETVMRRLGVAGDPIDFSLPVKPDWSEPWMDDLPKPFGIVHAPSVRRGWVNSSRNPRPEYVQAIIDATPDLNWVSVGWTRHDFEWFEGGPPRNVTWRIEQGELTTGQMLALIARASIALSGPSFMLPAAAALGVPVYVVFGGSLPPDFLIDPRMGPHVGHVAPFPFCFCKRHDHACHKEIDRERLLERFSRFRESMGALR